MRWFVGADHAGHGLKGVLAAKLRELGDEVVDLGTHDAGVSVDYPDFGAEVGRRVVAEAGTLGLCVCGSGIGIAIAANKVAGVRAARVTEPWSAKMAREHNDANVLCLGERVTGPGLAEETLLAFRAATFAGGRHAGRVAKLDKL